jgi:tRNA A37 methylthiotransferase MiaB
MEFSHLHIFRYSIRPGTAAAAMPGQVPDVIATDRSRRMHAIGADSEAAFKAALIGRSVEVLWERSEPFGDGSRWTGLTPSAVRIITETTGDRDLFNTITPARIVDALPGHVVGRVEDGSLPVVDLRR